LVPPVAVVELVLVLVVHKPTVLLSTALVVLVTDLLAPFLLQSMIRVLVLRSVFIVSIALLTTLCVNILAFFLVKLRSLVLWNSGKNILLSPLYLLVYKAGVVL
jgi:hypothetical protein